jgi:hypothetical protein
MWSRPVGRIPLKTLLFFSNPLVTLAPKPFLQKSRFLASLEMTIFHYGFNANPKAGTR